MTDWRPTIPRRAQWAILIVIALLAFGLRAFGFEQSPGGWRDDELSNALVVSQHVREGEVRLYYDDASGHEGLYHWLQAGTMLLFGPGIWGIRGISILFGTLTVILTYLLVAHLFEWHSAALTALLMSVSFWSLMYSRSGQRHISVLVTTVLAFYFLWRAVQITHSKEGNAYIHFALAGVCIGTGFYTYFAARGVPLILIGWTVYLLIWKLDELKTIWRGLLLTLIIAAVLATPLILILQSQPEAEARVAELAKPIYDAHDGDFSTIGQFALTTLSMFTHDGDDEVLYNLPHRPVFALLGGLLFWVGVLISAFRTFGPTRDSRHAFLLLWLFAGLSPGVLSVPAASLGHTLLAQPIVYIMPVLAISEGGHWLASRQSNPRIVMAAILALSLTLFGWEALRGLRDYFLVWPQDSFARVLHHADLHDAAQWLNTQSDTRDVAIGSFLTERWDQQVMHIDLDGDDWQVRAFDPRSTYLQTHDGGYVVLPEYLTEGWGVEQLGDPLPVDGRFAAYRLPLSEAHEPIAVFERGLTLDQVEVTRSDNQITLILGWQVIEPLDLPPFPLYSKPPAPDEDATPRLAIFTQVLDEAGGRVAGADALGVDPYTLQPGDRFLQRFDIPLDALPPGDYHLITGLYNPHSGERWLTTTEQAGYIELEAWSIP